MNILIPHSWLLEHLATEVPPTELQKLVSLCGPSVERIYEREAESVYDIEVTTNRVDSMCVRGVAREAAVILQQFGHSAKLKPLTTPNLQTINAAKRDLDLPLPTINNQTSACKRVLCVLLDQVQHTATPDWMARRLRQTDQTIHDSVIDITNYVTHELGYPCHAFDYDKLMKLGGVINIIEAQPSLPFVTLDGAKHTTLGGEVVFTNQTGEIIDLPAIMGTANSSVDETTTRVLFWIESLDAKKVRTASMGHAIRTTAAQLEEKGADPITAELVIARGVELYQQLCHAKQASGVFDLFPQPPALTPVATKLSTIENYLGLPIATETIKKILANLECSVTATADTLVVTPPSFRPDIEIEADVVEEIARIYGYQNLPSTIMPGTIPLTKQEGVNFTIERQCKDRLAALGWQELYTYSMVSEALAAESGYTLTEHLKLANPLTDDKIYLRRSLVPSLLAVAKDMHTTAGTKAIQVFEIANTYEPSKASELPIESLNLVLLSNQSLSQFKGQLEALLDTFYLKLPTSNEQSSLITLSSPADGWFAAVLPMVELVNQAKTHPSYQPLAKYPNLLEDLTFTVPAKTGLGVIAETIKAVDPLVQSVTLSSTYQQNATYTISYTASDRALSSTDIAPIRKAIVEKITTVFGATLVGALS